MTLRTLAGLLACVATLAAHAQPLNWKQLPGAAQDIGVGPRGEVWVVGTNKTYPNDYGIHRFDGSQWAMVKGGAVRIDVGPEGPWVVNAAGALYRWNNNDWAQVPGQVRDVGVGANGSVWAIGMNAQPGGFQVYRYNGGTNWSGMPGAGVRIDVDPKGNAWIVNDAKAIFRWTGSAFQQVPGVATDIGIGADGSVWIVGPDNAPHQWNGSSWIRRDGVLAAISVDPRGQPWGVNARQEIYAANFTWPVLPAAPGDVTAKLETLGNPGRDSYGGKIYPRNPWDMKAFRGRVYIGSGNSNNEGPDPNAGPVTVWAFDPALNKFVSEWQVNDEQVDLFRVAGSTLVIPGHDPRQNWSKGNFYRKAGDGWQEVRTVDMAIHMYDIAERSEGTPQTLGGPDTTGFSTKYLAAAIATPSGAEVAISTNGGQSWTKHGVIDAVGARSRTFLSTPSAFCVSAHTNPNYSGVNNAINTVTGILGSSAPRKTNAWLVTSKGVTHTVVNLFPGLDVPHMFAAKSERFLTESFYFGAYAPIDHNWKSEGLFATRDCKSARRVSVPGKWFHHLVVDSGRLYVATSTEEAGGRRTRIHASSDGSTFKEVLQFWNRGFARSFAILNGDFYFGIGSEAEAPHDETGAILRLRAADLPK